MRVVLLYGSRAGEEVDLPPRNAQAMLADGRARLPGTVHAGHAEALPVVAVQVDARADRGLPRHRRRAVR
jgi:hypothetical protein